MVCEAQFSDAHYAKRLIGVSEFALFAKGGQRSISGTKQSTDTRTFLSGWETGVDSQLIPPKVVYTIRTVTNKRDLLGSLYGKTSARLSKPFAFIHSLDPEIYLKYYTDEHSYLANLFVQPSVQRLTSCLIAPPSPSQSQPLVASVIQTLPPVAVAASANSMPTTTTTTGGVTNSAFDGVWSVAKKYSLTNTVGVKTQTRIQGVLSEPSAVQQQSAGVAAVGNGAGNKRTASNLSQQVDLLTNGRARGDVAGDRKSDSLSLISSEMLPVVDSETAVAGGPPRRVSTPDRARQRDFTCPGFAPALMRRLELLAAAEVAGDDNLISAANLN